MVTSRLAITKWNRWRWSFPRPQGTKAGWWAPGQRCGGAGWRGHELSGMRFRRL